MKSFYPEQVKLMTNSKHKSMEFQVIIFVPGKIPVFHTVFYTSLDIINLIDGVVE